MGMQPATVQPKALTPAASPVKAAIHSLGLPPVPESAEKQPGLKEQSADVYRSAVGVLAMVLNPMGLGVNPSAADQKTDFGKMKMPERAERHAKRDTEYKDELKRELAIRLLNSRLTASAAMTRMPNTADQKQVTQVTAAASSNESKADA